MKFCSLLCINISTADQVLVLAKWSEDIISARPKTSSLPFVTVTACGLEDGSKKVKYKLAGRTDLAELIGHGESYWNN